MATATKQTSARPDTPDRPDKNGVFTGTSLERERF
jgi:hypothetical protein